jgi:HEAT repeat protein
MGLVALVAGCAGPRTPYPRALQSDRPGERMQACKRAAELQDRSVVGILVDRLDDDDEGVRLYAILALEKLTGTRLDYDYYAPEALRQRAIKRWRAYLSRSAADGRLALDEPAR